MGWICLEEILDVLGGQDRSNRGLSLKKCCSRIERNISRSLQAFWMARVMMLKEPK
jgi:hypothetical protein